MTTAPSKPADEFKTKIGEDGFIEIEGEEAKDDKSLAQQIREKHMESEAVLKEEKKPEQNKVDEEKDKPDAEAEATDKKVDEKVEAKDEAKKDDPKDENK